MFNGIIDVDELAGITEYMSVDEVTGEIRLTTEQRVDDILDHSKSAYNEFDERANWKGEWHRVAQIPMSLYMRMVEEGRTKDTKAMHAWLNDKDNRFFRTRPGVI